MLAARNTGLNKIPCRAYAKRGRTLPLPRCATRAGISILSILEWFFHMSLGTIG
jgi:hypothetical protein